MGLSPVFRLALMNWVIILSLIVIVIVVFFCWANNQAKKQHAAFTKDDVVKAIENVFANELHDEWDLFLAWPINDPYLESVRQKCLLIFKEHQGKEKGKDIETTGEAKLQLILEELKMHV
jgi:hypothetical protein